VALNNEQDGKFDLARMSYRTGMSPFASVVIHSSYIRFHFEKQAIQYGVAWARP